MHAFSFGTHVYPFQGEPMILGQASRVEVRLCVASEAKLWSNKSFP